jgi:hypothetical protein
VVVPCCKSIVQAAPGGRKLQGAHHAKLKKKTAKLEYFAVRVRQNTPNNFCIKIITVDKGFTRKGWRRGRKA